jgi:hypothetical protein
LKGGEIENMGEGEKPEPPKGVFPESVRAPEIKKPLTPEERVIAGIEAAADEIEKLAQLAKGELDLASFQGDPAELERIVGYLKGQAIIDLSKIDPEKMIPKILEEGDKIPTLENLKKVGSLNIKGAREVTLPHLEEVKGYVKTPVENALAALHTNLGKHVEQIQSGEFDLTAAPLEVQKFLGQLAEGMRRTLEMYETGTYDFTGLEDIQPPKLETYS